MNAKNNVGQTALMMATHNNHIEIVTKLLEVSGIDLNATDDKDWNALMIAVHGDRNEIVAKLLEITGIEVNSKNSDDWSPLKIAVCKGNIKVSTMYWSLQKSM